MHYWWHKLVLLYSKMNKCKASLWFTRQFLSKSMRLDNLDEKQIKQIESNLDNRPRKVIGFKTPLEINVTLGALQFKVEYVNQKPN